MVVEQYTYEMKKSIMPGFLVKGVKIDSNWVSRCKRFMGASGCNLNSLVKFINSNLTNRKVEGFNTKALDTPLSDAQKWTLLHLVLKDEVPDWIRDEEKDEDVPELIEAEPQVDGIVKKTVSGALKPVTSLFKDSDGDGIPDEEDPDDDNDGIPDEKDTN